MAAHPAIVRYYLEGGDSRVVRVLRGQAEEVAQAGHGPGGVAGTGTWEASSAKLVSRMGYLTEGRTAGQARELDFSPWGGAYNRVPADATAFVHRDPLYSLKHAVVVDPAASTAAKQAAHRWATRSWASVHRWGTGGGCSRTSPTPTSTTGPTPTTAATTTVCCASRHATTQATSSASTNRCRYANRSASQPMVPTLDELCIELITPRRPEA